MKSKPFIILVVLSIILPLAFFYLVHDDKPELVKLESNTCKDIPANQFEKIFFDKLSFYQKKITKPNAENDWQEFINWHFYISPCLDGAYAEAMNGAWANGFIFGMDDFLKIYSNHHLKNGLLPIFLNFYNAEDDSVQDSFQNSCSKTPSPTCEELIVSIAESTPSGVPKK